MAFGEHGDSYDVVALFMCNQDALQLGWCYTRQAQTVEKGARGYTGIHQQFGTAHGSRLYH